MRSRPTVYLVAGLPGSGKTTLLAPWANANKLRFFDDFYCRAREGRMEDALEREELERRLASGETCIIADITYCKPPHRAKAEDWVRGKFPEANIRWIYFENDADACRRNVCERDRSERRDRELKYITDFSPGYGIPERATVIPVIHRNSGAIDLDAIFRLEVLPHA